MNKTIRWQQRFENFENAYKLLAETCNIQNPSEAERAGLIHFFELSFELAWKVMKDYLETQGFQTKTPRETLKQAFQMDIIENGHLWLEALGSRNMTTHTYDEEVSLEIEQLIKKSYRPMLQQLYNYLKDKK